ncbi:MAG: class I SAM-dependent methyltransferase [Gammaproteobacteria bacterium]|nr:MAG: class I SAM-dependent methyltransferase [Gammaproteobacteria bacterium]
MNRMVDRLDRALYPGQSSNWDDYIFRDRILSNLSPEAIILDIGAGAGIVQQMNFKGMVAKVCGIDLDPRVECNPMLDEGKVSDAGHIPYPDAAFDVAFADNVMEHLTDPTAVLGEVCRVLRPGGVFLFKTPNRTHYMPLIARMTPHRFHRFVNRLRGRAEEDTFPTLYRANTAADVRKLAASAGLAVDRLERIEGRPEYLRITWPTYLLGAAYERVVNTFDFLAIFRILLIAQLRKAANAKPGIQS